VCDLVPCSHVLVRSWKHPVLALGFDYTRSDPIVGNDRMGHSIYRPFLFAGHATADSFLSTFAYLSH